MRDAGCGLLDAGAGTLGRDTAVFAFGARMTRESLVRKSQTSPMTRSIAVGLVFHAELESVSGMFDTEDCATDGLFLARTGMILFQGIEDRRRRVRVELEDDLALVGDARLLAQLAVECRELAVSRVHEKPDFLR